jgi:hypothetical protein
MVRSAALRKIRLGRSVDRVEVRCSSFRAHRLSARGMSWPDMAAAATAVARSFERQSSDARFDSLANERKGDTLVSVNPANGEVSSRRIDGFGPRC